MTPMHLSPADLPFFMPLPDNSYDSEKPGALIRTRLHLRSVSGLTGQVDTQTLKSIDIHTG